MRFTMKILTLFALSLTMLMVLGGCASKKKSYKKGSPATMRTYKVHGKRYHPTYVKLGQKMKGISSWYGPNFHGKSTSNGERYNMHAKTAAHKTWPMNTMVKVTNLQNGKSTVVRINDRGPFVRGRIIDCSYRAGKEIGLDRMGIAKVQIQVLGFAGKVQSPEAVKKMPASQKRIILSNFGIQVGAFRRLEGAQTYQRQYAQMHPEYKVIIKKMHDEEGYPINRVWLMGFGSEDEARDYKATHHLPGAFIVRE
ncbi:MAG: septal ring lytic transglycosylase RlpA family protein [Campylobacterota bacterium]|nr:septal ring lytic transglycosylase RlpA family protein [Campylobacterota bacterium]